jgi:hypothetical protein
LSVIHHRQNPLLSTLLYVLILDVLLIFLELP